MSLLRNVASGLRSLFRKELIKRESDEELRGYLEMAAEEKMKQGIHPCATQTLLLSTKSAVQRADPTSIIDLFRGFARPGRGR